MLAIAAVVVGFILSGCSSTKTYGSDCGLVVGNGVGDVRQVKHVVHPGEKSTLKGDDEDFFVPCNPRNYRILPSGPADRHTPMIGTTAKVLDDKGTLIAAGTPVKAYGRFSFILNQDDNVIGKEFYPFCRKYACASRDHAGGEDTDNFGTKGWTGMLDENHSDIVDIAFKRAIVNFDSNIWNEPEKWDAVAAAMTPIFMEEMQKADLSKDDFFCGRWTPADPKDPGVGTGKCDPITFTLTRMDPPTEVLAAYNANIKAGIDAQNALDAIKRQETQVSAEKDLADKRAALYKIPGYREQIAHQYALEEIKACGAAGLKVCGGGTSGVLVSGN
jgi:hypothetical protein